LVSPEGCLIETWYDPLLTHASMSANAQIHSFNEVKYR